MISQQLITGRLVPATVCQNLNHSFETMSYGTEILIQKDSVQITIKSHYLADLETVLRRAVLNIAGTLDGQMLLSGQPVQLILNHPILRRLESEAIYTSCLIDLGEISQEQLGTGIQIGQMAEIIPPLAHALRDYRIARILPPEDGAMFLWRSVEFVAWDIIDKSPNVGQKLSGSKDLPVVEGELNITSGTLNRLQNNVNHELHYARHASKSYYQRKQHLKKVFGDRIPPFYTGKIAGNDDETVVQNGFCATYSDADWNEMLKVGWEVLVQYISSLKPRVVGHLIFPPW